MQGILRQRKKSRKLPHCGNSHTKVAPQLDSHLLDLSCFGQRFKLTYLRCMLLSVRVACILIILWLLELRENYPLGYLGGDRAALPSRCCCCSSLYIRQHVFLPVSFGSGVPQQEWILEPEILASLTSRPGFPHVCFSPQALATLAWSWAKPSGTSDPAQQP